MMLLRCLALSLALVFLLCTVEGCATKLKDEIPTGTIELPKEGPVPVGGGKAAQNPGPGENASQ